MIKFNGHKLTPNQVAKEILIDGMIHHKEFWQENFRIETDFSNRENNPYGNYLTEKQIEQVKEQISKRLEGIINYLGGSPIVNIHLEQKIKERKVK